MTFNPSDYLMKLKGKDYLEVKHRIQWFRDDCPNGDIRTELFSHGNDEAVFKATVSRPDGGGATGWGSEEKSDFGDYVEKAETKAIGRALAALGYGTQFCEDHDFGAASGRVVDAPTQLKPKGNAGGGEVFACEECGSVIKDTVNKSGKTFTAADKAALSQRDHGKILCYPCIKKAS